MERFEPSTLSGPVFETGAYTIPPHRHVVCSLMIAYWGCKVKYLMNLICFGPRCFGQIRCVKGTNGTEFLVAVLQECLDRLLL